MALGSPAINTPNALDLRALQTAISNTRQRIEQLEKQLGTVSSTAASATSTVSLSAILSKLAALQTEIDNLEDLTAQIEALPFSSGVTQTAEVPVVMNGVGVRVTAGDIARLAGGSVDLGALIAALSYSSNVDPSWQVPVEIGGIAMRVNAGDMARLLFGLPFNSGVDASALVPVQMPNGTDVLVTAGDIARLGGGAVSLQALIDAEPASSGIDAHAQIPFTLAGFAFRADAADIARLIFTASFSSGVDGNMLVPVMQTNGTVVLCSAGDIARLGASTFTYNTLPPGSSTPGDSWFKSDAGVKFTFLNDGDSTQWVEC